MPARSVVQVTVALAVFIGAPPALLFDHDVPLWQTRKPPLMFRDAESSGDPARRHLLRKDT